jgi:hypothetical protein
MERAWPFRPIAVYYGLRQSKANLLFGAGDPTWRTDNTCAGGAGTPTRTGNALPDVRRTRRRTVKETAVPESSGITDRHDHGL